MQIATAICVLKCSPHQSVGDSPVLANTAQLVRKHRVDLAVTAFQHFVLEQPDDIATAVMMADLLLTAADAAAANGHCPEALAYLSVVADWRVARGDQVGAAKIQARIGALEVADIERQLASARRPHAYSPELRTRAAQARICVARGDAVAAAEFLTPEMADGSPALLLTIAEVQLRGGRLDEAVALVERAMTEDPSLTEAVAQLGVKVAVRTPDVGFLLVEMAATVWATRLRWREAVAAFRELVERAPHHTAARVRLREIEAARSSVEDRGVVMPFRRPRTA